jgi:ketosteroid isomerase-like protein
MKRTLFLIPLLFLVLSCSRHVNTEAAKDQIREAEKSFEKMASEKGLAEAFYFFADENAVIRRGNDSLITGKENIRHFYVKNTNPNAKLSWAPDFVVVADCGTLGYTYGKYTYTLKDSTGKVTTRSGIFHTVWKKQNNEWKYVWD